MAELDGEYSKARGGNFSIEIVIDKGMTRREAMQRVHWCTMAHYKGVEYQATLEHKVHGEEKQRKQPCNVNSTGSSTRRWTTRRRGRWGWRSP